MIRRWITGVLVLLLLLSAAGWIFYIPSAMLNTLRPVPQHAQIVCRSTLPDISVLEPFHFFNGWKTAGRFFQTLGKNPLTAATVSLGGRDRRDVWIVSSAVGPRAVLLRWRLKLSPPEGVSPVRSYGSWPVWQYNDSSLPPWMRIRFSITDGLLVCSVSDESHDIFYLLDTLDGRRPSAEGREL